MNMTKTPASFTITSTGELHERALANAERLERDVFEPQAMFERMAGDKWPGDTEGRLLLGQVLMARTLNRQSRTLDELLALWDNYTNELGYFGPVHGNLNEQQLSSHGWTLRGLCELHKWRGCDWSLERIKKIVNALALPCKGKYKTYPIDERDGMALGMHSGESAKERDGWTLSTDFGCAFIFMDGVIQSYGILGGDELRQVCEEMIARYVEIDIIKLGLQTHATLTALRGLARFYQLHPERGDLLAAIVERFDLYLGKGMSESWANHNWFNDPRWTEPCAIVDSLQVARQLWQFTGDVHYRDLIQLIRWNAFAHGQRSNGGFGPDTCVGSSCEDGGSEHQLRPSVPEAYWCCSMRGAEGLSDLMNHQLVEKDGIIFASLAESCQLHSETYGEIKIISAYPWQGQWQISVSKTGSIAPTIALAAPAWCTDWQLNGELVEPENGWLFVDLSADTTCEITCHISIQRQEQLGQENQSGWFAWRHGPVMLARNGTDLIHTTAVPKQTGQQLWTLGDTKLVPISENWRRPLPEREKKQPGMQPYTALTQQVLWPK